MKKLLLAMLMAFVAGGPKPIQTWFGRNSRRSMDIKPDKITKAELGELWEIFLVAKLSTPTTRYRFC